MDSANDSARVPFDMDELCKSKGFRQVTISPLPSGADGKPRIKVISRSHGEAGDDGEWEYTLPIPDDYLLEGDPDLSFWRGSR